MNATTNTFCCTATCTLTIFCSPIPSGACIDLEDVHQGPPCHDLGSFIASQLTRDALESVGNCDNVASLDSVGAATMERTA